MGYPKHCLLVFGGSMGDEEAWSCSLRMTSASMAILPDGLLDGFAASAYEEVAEKVQSYITGLAGNWHLSARLGFVKFNGIGPDGKYVGDTHQVIRDPEFVSSNTSSRGPFQLTMAVSLATQFKRGLAAHGRWYLPAPPFSVNPAGYIANSVAMEYAVATKNFIDSLNDWQGTDPSGAPDVSVVSRGKKLGNNSWGEGRWSRVTEVRVGNVMDTQQSRRRSLVESYQSLEITP
uniref:Uncharacterized protein n=1 Tax=uncultured prokaryote TaxID=198431 RepID=A0A0H5Q3C4_9ZZZZ|nr:hypothetical protein [uncultured prokaryote]